jgi:hypothetical protein
VENIVAQKLYVSLGFQPQRWMCNFYQDEKEDAIFLRADLSTFTEVLH